MWFCCACFNWSKHKLLTSGNIRCFSFAILFPIYFKINSVNTFIDPQREYSFRNDILSTENCVNHPIFKAPHSFLWAMTPAWFVGLFDCRKMYFHIRNTVLCQRNKQYSRLSLIGTLLIGTICLSEPILRSHIGIFIQI